MLQNCPNFSTSALLIPILTCVFLVTASWICKVLIINALCVFAVDAPSMVLFHLAIELLSGDDRAGMALQKQPYRNAIGDVLGRNKICVRKLLMHKCLRKWRQPQCHSLLMTGKIMRCQLHLPKTDQ